MRKVIAAINMTLDGFCDHTAGIPDMVIELKQQPGRDILVGSRSLIIQLMKLNLIILSRLKL